MRLPTQFAALALLVAAPAIAQPAAPSPRMAVTQHEGVFNGQRLRYTATVAESVLAGEGGKPAATAFTIAYVRDDVPDRAKRPVLFAFNGGPGASSSPLHMSALGPVLRGGSGALGDRGEGPLRPNPDSPLDACDLVFIDPVGTGFGRVLPGADGKPFFSVAGDAEEVRNLITGWLKANGRETSPRYLIGESYGTVRAPAIAAAYPELKLDGVMLVALVSDVAGREMPFVASLPTLAAGAWFHQRVPRGGRTVEQAFDEAWRFARTDYAAALIQGASLPSAEKRRIARRMSALIGLPTEVIERENLRISSNTWMFNLLKDKGLRTGLLDVRVTGPLTPDAQGGIDDPALGVAPRRAPGAAAGPPPTPQSIGPVPSPAVGKYLTEALKFPAGGEPYIGVNFTVNSQWSYGPAGARAGGLAGPSSAALTGLAKAMRANPKLRLFWAGGYYDLTTPARAARYTLDQVGVPPAQLTAAFFAGPHGVYEGDDNRRRFDTAVRDFVTAH